MQERNFLSATVMEPWAVMLYVAYLLADVLDKVWKPA